MVKINRPWANKKEPTNPKKKEQHSERKTKKAVLHELEEADWQEELQEYYADSTIQE